jgi:hypothetical protein
LNLSGKLRCSRQLYTVRQKVKWYLSMLELNSHPLG